MPTGRGFDALMESFRTEFPDADVADLRDAAISAVEQSLYVFGDQAAALACGFFDAFAERSGASERAVPDFDAVDLGRVDRSVRSFAKDLVDGKKESFNRSVTDLSRFCVKRSAYENLVRNCDRNDLRYARVTSGRESCSFCFMLSSRGFVYSSEAEAKGEHGTHDGCDCVVVPGFKGLERDGQIQGYEPDEMWRRWASCEKTVGGTEAVEAEWKAMAPEERERYKGDSDQERFERFSRARIMREVETRDWRWLYTGEPPAMDCRYRSRESYGKMKKPNDYSEENLDDRSEDDWRDLLAIDTLQSNGFSITIRPREAVDKDGKLIDGVSNPDIFIGNQLWEIESPRNGSKSPKPGNELDFVGEQLRSSKRNFKNPYDPETKEPMSSFDGKKRVVLNLKYRDFESSDKRLIGKVRSEMRTYCIDVRIA